MQIGIIDADLIGRDRHRFPNLVCEKISKYWKDQGADVHLLLRYKAKASCMNGIESVKKNADSEIVEE